MGMMLEVTDIALVEKMLLSAQKARSNAVELDWLTDEDRVLLAPWLFGEHTVMIALEKVVEAGKVEPNTLYNLLVICKQLEPSVGLIHYVRWGEDLPDPLEYLTKALAR